jgi:hypothetical protein
VSTSSDAGTPARDQHQLTEHDETTLIRLRTYEITFTGRAGHVLRAAFDDCTVIVGPGTTTLRAQLPDQAALWGLVQRIISLGLEVVDLHLVAPE